MLSFRKRFGAFKEKPMSKKIRCGGVKPVGVCDKCYADWVSDGEAGPLYCEPCEIMAVRDDQIGSKGGYVLMQGLSREDYERHIAAYLRQKLPVDQTAH